MGETVKVRIAVAYDLASGGWNTCGWSDGDDTPDIDDHYMMDLAVAPHVFPLALGFVTATFELPEPGDHRACLEVSGDVEHE